MKRTTRIHLTALNPGKAASLYAFLGLYRNVVAYFVERFWSAQSFDNNLADKAITDAAISRFGITARLAQCAAKQAKELVRSQRERGSKTMPKVKAKTATLDARFWKLEDFAGSHFELCCRFSSGLPSLTVPFNRTAHFNKFIAAGWTLADTIRLGCDRWGRLWIELIFKKERAPQKTEGEIRGIDRGFRKPVVMSDGQVVGEKLCAAVKNDPRIRRRSFRHWLRTELNRELKKLDLSQVKIVILEDLRHIKRGKRGTFPRRVNRLLSFWLMTRVVEYVRQRGEEMGFGILTVSPFKTSQRCSDCGKIDRRNRRGERFQCVGCGAEKDADHNAARNLEFLGVAGVYSLRVLPN